MATPKRKKEEREYSYYEYLQKFRPKSMREEDEERKKSALARRNKSTLENAGGETVIDSLTNSRR